MINISTNSITAPNLGQLMQSQRGDACCVAFDSGQLFLWGDFRRQVSFLSDRLSRLPEQRWVLYSQSSYQFVIGLMALWHAGKSAIIPGDNLSATIDHIRPEADAFLGDFGSEVSLPIIEHESAAEIQAFDFKTLDPEQCRLTVLTSGSTGLPKFICFRLRQLEDELQILESLWGQELHQASIISSVSHQHLYGLTFRLCWPLAAGRPFSDRNCNYMEELVNYCQSAQKLCLITSPSHLSRLPEALPWKQLQQHWTKIFCSTAPLSPAASHDANMKFGVEITEIFGSSEAGAMAWRHQTQTSHWHALPGVRISIETESNTLRLQSPLLEPPTQWMQTADKIELINEQQFRLLGRIDRIVKVEGKRVSLSAMERRLEEHSWIISAKALVLPPNGRRCDLAIVAVLDGDALDIIAQHGKRKLNLIFREHLKNHFESPVLPRRWRYPESLPENSQGKITQQALITLFLNEAAQTQPKN